MLVVHNGDVITLLPRGGELVLEHVPDAGGGRRGGQHCVCLRNIDPIRLVPDHVLVLELEGFVLVRAEEGGGAHDRVVADREVELSLRSGRTRDQYYITAVLQHGSATARQY